MSNEYQTKHDQSNERVIRTEIVPPNDPARIDLSSTDGAKKRLDIFTGSVDDPTKSGVEDPRHFIVVDLKDEPRDADGNIPYEGVTDPIPSDIRYLMIQPASLDWSSKKPKGYKGLRLGEVVEVGRNQEKDPENRFVFSGETSRKHFSIAVDTDGKILLEDQGSSNGTTFSVTEETPESDDKSDHTRPVNVESLRTMARVRVLPREYVKSISDIARDDNAPIKLKELLSDEAFKPRGGIELDSGAYAVSNPFKSGGREYVVAYREGTDSQGVPEPRLFYKSNSDGGWRSTPGFYEDGIISKGSFRGEEYGQYVVTTKPAEELVQLFETMSADGIPDEEPGRYRRLRELFPQSESSLESQVNFTMIPGYGLDAFVSGTGYSKYGKESGRSMLENMVLPDKFEPDFMGRPSGVYEIEHTLLGKSQVEVYESEYLGKPIEWHIASDGRGRVWIDRIAYKNQSTTTYGTSKDVILAGALNMKPIDYVDQINGDEGSDYAQMTAKGYGDLWPTIRRMPWAKRYLLSQQQKNTSVS